METKTTNKPSVALIIAAFAIIYIVWGSTYFFIQMAVHGFPPMLLGAFRFLTAGLLLLAWCRLKNDRIWIKKNILSAAVSGLLMLFTATGGIIWAEQSLPSAIVAIMVSANPIWFVALDKGNWKVNLSSKSTLAGLIVGFSGVILLFAEAIVKSLAGTFTLIQVIALVLVMLDPIAWSLGALLSKKNTTNTPARVSSAWQMIIAGLAFVIAALVHQEFKQFQISNVPASAWMALGYLILFGSIAAFSAYIWLLKVRSAVQVSSHSYVNPVVAVMLGALGAHESISVLQLFGLLVILGSVLLINAKKYAFKRPKFSVGHLKIRRSNKPKSIRHTNNHAFNLARRESIINRV
jgi:drug/metabolite transporter (DMT)-like permease